MAALPVLRIAQVAAVIVPVIGVLLPRQILAVPALLEDRVEA
jgi:hypothetical protein